ncbi:MAG: RluA family pseudouridine synthase [Bacteroides sp.]|nr:RluA family pseudouridine synthase [Bacillota bacterium]MCM1393454.1 RluA family pseudouridine synthase [[Eubacterium] siraeum]MCM1455046.1 RluA family pseudouridine synthase [Bacteroides sp.]
MATVTADKIRLDVFIAKTYNVSRSSAKNYVEEFGATVNGVLRNKSGLELRVGDEVEFEPPKPRELEIKAENIPLDIVYQDEYFAVVNKPQGMVVHQASSYKKSDTLVNALLYNLDSLSSINGVIRPGIVHRLDKDTSGLIVVAKNDEAHKSLAAQIEKKSARRIYIGLCDGNFKEDCGTVDAPIARNPKDRKKMAIVDGGRRAVTHYTALKRYGKYTLVRFELETGRTHQIRVHASSLHHPIVGDEVYGGSTALYKNGQLLHATELILNHPHTGETMVFNCPVPNYFQAVLDKLDKIQTNSQ